MPRPPKRAYVESGSDSDDTCSQEKQTQLQSPSQPVPKKRGRPFKDPNHSLNRSATQRRPETAGVKDENVRMRGGAGAQAENSKGRAGSNAQQEVAVHDQVDVVVENSGGRRPAPRPLAKFVQTPADITRQVRLLGNHAARIQTSTLPIVLTIGDGPDSKGFSVFLDVLIPYSTFFRELLSGKDAGSNGKESDLAGAPANPGATVVAVPNTGTRSENKQSTPTSNSQAFMMQRRGEPASRKELEEVQRQVQPNASSSSNASSSPSPPTKDAAAVIKAEPQPGSYVANLQKFEDKAGARMVPIIDLELSDQESQSHRPLTILSSISSTQFRCFLHAAYRGTITYDIIKEYGLRSPNSSNLKDTIEGLWFLGAKLGSPSFQNRIMQALISSEAMQNGSWPRLLDVKLMERELSSAPRAECRLRDLAVACIVANRPLNKYKSGTQYHNAWASFFNGGSTMTTDLLMEMSRPDQWVESKPWGPKFSMSWFVKEEMLPSPDNGLAASA